MPLPAPCPIRVLMVSGPAAGGLKRHVQQLAAGLAAVDVELAAAGPQANALGIQPWFPFELGDRPRPLMDLGALQQLRTAAKKWRPELIHAHGAKAALLSLLAFPFGVPRVVVTYHNRWLGGPLTGPLRLLAPRAHASIAVSSAVAQSLRDHAIRPEKLQVILNGIDPQVFHPAPGTRSARPFTLLFLGRLTEEKGVPLLLKLARRLVARADLRLLVAGDGPLQPQLEEAAARPGSILEYLGRQNDVLALYHRADAVLMPSLSEGLPMAGLEAMACGLPLLASAVGGLPELVQDGVTGALLPERELEVWTQTILELAADLPRAMRLGAAGRKKVEQEFAESRMLDELLGVYRAALRSDVNSSSSSSR